MDKNGLNNYLGIRKEDDKKDKELEYKMVHEAQAEKVRFRRMVNQNNRSV